MESIIICFELTAANAATYCFLLYGVALNQQPLFSKSLPFTSAHTMLPRIAYLFGHRQANTSADSRRWRSRTDGISERCLQADGLSKINTRGWDAAANDRKLSETAAALLVTRY